MKKIDIYLEIVNENVKYKNLDFVNGSIEIYIGVENYICDIFEDIVYEEWVFEFNNEIYPLKYLIASYDEEDFIDNDYSF